MMDGEFNGQNSEALGDVLCEVFGETWSLCEGQKHLFREKKS